jgi:hypothetical protein
MEGGAAWARGVAREGARCGAAVLEKAAAGVPCVGEGERRCFFRSCKALKRIERSGVSGVCFPVLPKMLFKHAKNSIEIQINKKL